MRSELVYSAGTRIPNRFLLSTVAIMAVRKLHVNSTRIEETANRVFTDLAGGTFTDVTMPQLKPQPLVDSVLVSVAA
ncbi:hypothetical protein [Silvibacterium acidisoli]|uniref:hypothetical protein n=1 Tax=Acidobacteriaceae bacterium ZG23-2 TaxID=2883246 RepID=UPI00406BF6E5